MAYKKLTIYRYNPEQDSKPYMQDFELDTNECQGNMLLDALELIKSKDPTLALRRSCGAGVCGSDAMNINGKNNLACQVDMRDMPKHITLRPLPAFPVIRDLIVDMTEFYQHYQRIQPYLQTTSEAPERERLQSPEEREELEGLHECILCACCTTACPSYWWNPDKFLGPAALLWAYRFVADSREEFQAQRLQELHDLFSLFRCRSIMNCTDVCPKGLNPTKAIGKLREKMLENAV
jgi:succinate dehydrogenase / fumarate reductase iron-sulfur subunit